MEKLRVLFLPAWYPSQFNKVGGVFVREHAKAVNQQVDLAVFHVCEHPHLQKFYGFEEVIEENILTYRVYYRKFSAKWLKPVNFLLFFIAAVVGYQKVKNKFHPQLNHVHVLTRMGVIALLANFFYRTPFVITEHWTRYLPERNSYRGALRKRLTKLIVKNSLGISSVSQNLKSALLGHGLKHLNFMLIPNVIDTDLFVPGNKSDIGFVFVHVSGINDKAKNISGLLRAFKGMLLEIEYSKELRLVIVGDDVLEKPILEKYAKDLDLDEHVLFVGKKYGKDLVHEYQKANAFVMFSNFENQPCVILEAMSCGLPVLSSSVGGISEIVDDHIGVLVAARDEKALQQGMLSLYQGTKVYSSDFIRDKAENNFSYPEVCSKLINFYSVALGRKI